MEDRNGVWTIRRKRRGLIQLLTRCRNAIFLPFRLYVFPMNTLYYGDNLKILREYIKDESVDLIYLDPPFNSNRNYNVLFKDESGSEADSQITAFEE